MKYKGGFTIIELVIATAIIVVVLAVSLPRFISYNRQQDFALAAGDAVECLQAGQREAATPILDTAYRFTMVTLDTTSGSFTCRADVFGRNDSSNVEITPDRLAARPDLLTPTSSSLLKQVSNDIISLDTTSSYGNNLANARKVILVFGGSEKGVLVFGCTYTSANLPADMTKPCPNPVLASSTGNGFAFSTGILDKNTASFSKPTGGTISVGTLGLPIAYESNE